PPRPPRGLPRPYILSRVLMWLASSRRLMRKAGATGNEILVRSSRSEVECLALQENAIARHFKEQALERQKQGDFAGLGVRVFVAEQGKCLRWIDRAAKSASDASGEREG